MSEDPSPSPRKSASKSASKPASGGSSERTTARRARSESAQSARKSGTAKKSSAKSGGASRSRRPGAVQVGRAALEQLAELSGRSSESVVGVQRTDDGWEVDVEAVETARIPDTTDVLAIYRVELDEAGTLLGYHRLDRYLRGSGDGQRG